MNTRTNLKIILFFCILILFSFNSYAGQRIISLKPNITEILFALGMENNIVGVTTYCDYPAKAKKIPKVGDYTRPFFEKIISLKPDFIISSKQESSKRSITELDRLGIKIFLFPFNTLEDIFSSTLNIGEITNKKEEAGKLVTDIQGDLSLLKKKYKSFEQKRVLVVWGISPLIVGGQGTYIDDIFDFINAKNIVDSTKTLYPHWSIEKVIKTNPDVIIDFSGSHKGNNTAVIPAKAGIHLFQQPSEGKGKNDFWNNLGMLNAVKNKRIYFLDPSEFRPSTRIAEATSVLGELIHMNKFEARNPKF